MAEEQTLTSEDISKIVDGFDPIDWEEVKLLKAMPSDERCLVSLRKVEALRTDLRNKLMKDYPELPTPEINMKMLRSLTPVQMGKSYTEPAYYEHFG